MNSVWAVRGALVVLCSLVAVLGTLAGCAPDFGHDPKPRSSAAAPSTYQRDASVLYGYASAPLRSYTLGGDEGSFGEAASDQPSNEGGLESSGAQPSRTRPPRTPTVAASPRPSSSTAATTATPTAP
jgi:hypothetical protein